MKVRFSILLATAIVLQTCTAPPVTKTKTDEADSKENEINDKESGLEEYMEYHRYLKEVVDALESDPQFREKLEKAEEADIRSGKIAHELEFVNHKVRTKLDEIKRSELERLRHLANKQYELENGFNFSHDKVGVGSNNNNEHLDHANPHTFEIDDLKKLISKSTQDLAEADQKRREEFKEYEMQKEFEKQEKLKSLDDTHKAELIKELEKQEQLHKKHDPLHHPGSKQQLEEVWEKQDHMDQQDFNPKTFFMLHDLDGNGVWDQNEVKTLFIKELDKMYNEGAPEDDMRERIEEMERMREHVFIEVDQNKDGLISYEEFINQTKKDEFKEDKGWEGLDQQKVYTNEEYKHFEKQRMEEIERLIAQGMLPPHPGAPMYHDPRMQEQMQFPPQGHPAQVPPSYHGQVPQMQYHPGQAPVHLGQGQVPPQAMYHHPNQGQQPQYNAAQGQAQYHPNQVPQGQAQYQPNQVPQHVQYQPNQGQQAQYQPNQDKQAQFQPNQAQQAQYQPKQVLQGQQAKFQPGQVPQAKVNPQQLPNGQNPPEAPSLDQQADVQLNTNEIYPNKLHGQPASQGHKAGQLNKPVPVQPKVNQPEPILAPKQHVSAENQNKPSQHESPQAQQV